MQQRRFANVFTVAKQLTLESHVIIQFGVPPNRIDLINKIEKVTFTEAWEEKVAEAIKLKGETIFLYFIGLKQLIKNKKALDRPKDAEDLKYLKRKIGIID
jgi:hypothetical protein